MYVIHFPMRKLESMLLLIYTLDFQLLDTTLRGGGKRQQIDEAVKIKYYLGS